MELGKRVKEVENEKNKAQIKSDKKMIGKKCDSNQFMLIWLVLIFVHLKKNKDQHLFKKMKMIKDVLKTWSKFWKKTTTRWKVQEQLRRQFHLEVNFLIDFWCEVGFGFFPALSTDNCLKNYHRRSAQAKRVLF